MDWNASEFREELKQKVDRFDQAGAAALCEQLITHLSQRADDDPYPTAEAKRVLQLLRSKRWFVLMQNVAEALLGKVQDSVQIRRQYAQSLIDAGNITNALSELESLIADTAADPDENAEARGLKGRAYKQLYVNANNPSSKLNRTNLDRAVRSYLEVYNIDPKKHLWPGINTVALLLRANRDSVSLEGYPDPVKLAESILSEVKEREADSKAEQWDYATAVEACIALKKPDDAFEWLGKYIFEARYADAFELASTLRQLTEVWLLDETSEIGSHILPPLRAALLAREGGQVELSEGDLSVANKTIPVPKATYEKVFGEDSYKSYEWYKTGGERCSAVARIGRDSSQGFGSGFLLKGSDLIKTWGDMQVLVTNSHVISDDETVEDALRSDEAVITFQVLGPEQYSVAEILWTSPPSELDATIIKLDKPVPCDTLYPIAKKLPLVEASQRVYVIGYPGGGALSLSLQDNILLDHQDPRVHYRTPTMGGSSGSPVFNRQWVLMGLHHAGNDQMQRLNNNPGTYAANEGIWIGAIIKALGLEYVAKE